MSRLEEYLNIINEEGKCPPGGCIKKVGNKWRIVSNKTGKLWPQEYDSHESASNALKAYHAHH